MGHVDACDFHGVDKDGEYQDDYDWNTRWTRWLGLSQRLLLAGGESWMRWRHCFIGCCAGMAPELCSFLSHTWGCESSDWCFAIVASVGLARLVDYIFGGALRVPSFDIYGENPRFGLHLLYVTVIPCWRHCLESSDFLLGENMQPSIEWQRRLCTIFLLEGIALDFWRTYSVFLSVVLVVWVRLLCEVLLTMVGSFFFFFLFLCGYP
jgi:hypothetical protein